MKPKTVLVLGRNDLIDNSNGFSTSKNGRTNFKLGVIRQIMKYDVVIYKDETKTITIKYR